MKVDVEGAEERVLAGAAATLGGNYPMTVLLDVHPGRGVDPVAIARRLRAWGFAIAEDVGPRTRSITATR